MRILASCFPDRTLACCFSDGMLPVVVMAICEDVMPLLELLMMFMVLYKCLVLV